MVRIGRLLVVSAALLLTVAAINGCGSGEPSGTVTPADVQPTPPGTPVDEPPSSDET